MRRRCAEKKHGGQEHQALGRSRGGFSTKIHIAVDALGNPLRLSLTAGQESDVTQGAPLIKDFAAQAVIADKGYDSDELGQNDHRATGASSDSAASESQRTARV